MDLKEIKQLMSTLQESQLNKLILKKGDFEIHLEKMAGPASATAYHPPQPAHNPSLEPHRIAEPPAKKEGKYVASPMVGTYYATPGPDEAPFVKVGDKVHEQSVVCIVEAMKVMNEVKAGVAGTVAEILLDNAHPVEFGTRLLRIV